MLVVVVFFFFFKQKTAYEMRISDWSSDVCSSDLLGMGNACQYGAAMPFRMREGHLRGIRRDRRGLRRGGRTVWLRVIEIGRASCRERVCSTCRSRWSPYQ